MFTAKVVLKEDKDNSGHFVSQQTHFVLSFQQKEQLDRLERALGMANAGRWRQSADDYKALYLMRWDR